jgi:hypothetical protein
MPSKAEKLLSRAKTNKRNWNVEDLEALYFGFGFEIDNSKHRKLYHPDYPQLVGGSIPHSGNIHIYMVSFAVELIMRLKELQTKGE